MEGAGEELSEPQRLLQLSEQVDTSLQELERLQTRYNAETTTVSTGQLPAELRGDPRVEGWTQDLQAQTEFYSLLQRRQEDLLEDCSDTLDDFEKKEKLLRAEVALLMEKLDAVAETDDTRAQRELDEFEALNAHIKQLKEESSLKMVQNESLAGQLQALEGELGAAEEELRVAQAREEELRRCLAEEREAERREADELRTLDEELRADRGLLEDRERELQGLLELRRECHNRLQNLKGNIRVYLRVKPLTGQRSLVTAMGRSVRLEVPARLLKSDNQLREHQFTFEHVFDHSCAQEVVFDELRSLMMSVVDGYSVCIVAYGATGAGKTFTIVGDGSEAQKGLAPRALENLFETLGAAGGFERQWTATASLREIYLDTVKSLSEGEEEAVPIANVYEAFRVLQRALDRRVTMSTSSNERSSRSHLVFSLNVRSAPSGEGEQRNGNLVLVDLAGSERLDSAKVQGDRLKEMMSINKSLSALGDVMNALYRREKFVPFRNSKLTTVLQEYLCGDAKVVMIVNLSSDERDYPFSLASLKFAAKVGEVEGLGRA